MGMFFGGLDEEELNQPPADNFVYKQLKRARYNGIELCELDIICSHKSSDMYVIKDFKENGCPIVSLVSNNSQACEDFEWNFSKLYVVVPNAY